MLAVLQRCLLVHFSLLLPEMQLLLDLTDVSFKKVSLCYLLLTTCTILKSLSFSALIKYVLVTPLRDSNELQIKVKIGNNAEETIQFPWPENFPTSYLPHISSSLRFD